MEQKDFRIYLGGLWDADGCFGIAQRVQRWKSYQPFASITLCDPKAQIIFGMLEAEFGFKCLQKGNRHNPKWKVAYRYALHSTRACMFAAWIEPYLIIKQERARILMNWPKIENKLSFAQRIPIHEKQQEFYDRMKVLNKRGAL